MIEPRFQVGDEVRLRSSPELVGMVKAPPTRIQAQYWYLVRFYQSMAQQKHPEEDLEFYAEGHDVSSILQAKRFSGREALSNLLTHLKLTDVLRSQIYALYSSRTRFLPYQFKPLLKFIDSRNQRLLIADEVGLGKTIETGLILTELRKRQQDMTRVLVVPPAHLCRKWKDEMQIRFDRKFEILDSKRVIQFLTEYEADSTQATLWGIVSLQALRGNRVMERWEATMPDLDFVVFDEAGRLRNPETRSNHVASLLAETANAMLFLTATPVQTGDEDLFYLLRILDPEAFSDYYLFQQQLSANEHVLQATRAIRRATSPLATCLEELQRVEQTTLADRFTDNPIYVDLKLRLARDGIFSRRDLIELQRDLNSLNIFSHILSRTKKREVTESQPIRRARVIRKAPYPLEQEFYQQVTSLCRRAYAGAGNDAFMSFAVMQPQRQMASSMVAMVEYCKERMDKRLDLQDSSDIDPEDTDYGVDVTGRRIIPWQRLGDLESWKAKLEPHDSKLESLLEAIQALTDEEPDSKIIVFTFFKRTVAYLQRKLGERGLRALALTGDTKTNYEEPELDERLALLNKFRDDPEARILIATEVADEGLDLQFAHCIINYDLPWNPMRIEQRIGRVDRIGQESPSITIITLSMEDTIEDCILERLYGRIHIFEQSVGDLETILGDEVNRLQRDLFSKELSPSEEEARIRQTAEAIERRRIELERFESEAESLIGQDEFFMDEIEQATKKRRFVAGEELIIYLRNFLKNHYPRCDFELQDAQSELYRLETPPNLLDFVRGKFSLSDPELLRFLRKTMGGEVLLTTSTDYAQKQHQIEFLTFFHPLVRAINDHYAEHPDELHPVSHVRLKHDEIPKGSYVYFIYITEISGLRPHRDVELVALEIADGEPLDPDQSELLLWEMLSKSTTTPQAARATDVSQNLVSKAETLLVSRLDTRFQERKRLNEGLVANRRASLRETFERNRRIREERIARARALNRKPTYIKGLETGIKILEMSYHDRDKQLKEALVMSRSHDIRAAGIAEVI